MAIQSTMLGRTLVTALALVPVVFIWIGAFALFVMLTFVAMEEAGIAQVTTQPALHLGYEPGQINVTGRGWPAEQRVLIYLTGDHMETYTVAVGTVDRSGRFATSFLVPSSDYWAGQDAFVVIGWVEDSRMTAQTSLDIVLLP